MKLFHKNTHNPPKKNDKDKKQTSQIDNTVTIEDIYDDDDEYDDDVVILDDSKENRTGGSNDYKTKKITKRIALQTHFLPQIIEPRYLDCIKEETSDLSDLEKKR